MTFEDLISEMYAYNRKVLEAFGVYGKDEELLESREELCCFLAQEEAEKLNPDSTPSEEAFMNGMKKGIETAERDARPKINLIALTKAKMCPGDDEDIVMVNIQSISTVQDWGNGYTKLTFSNGEHLIVKNNIDEVLEFIDE